MAQALRITSDEEIIEEVVAERETFRSFFEFWLSEQSQQLEELVLASKSYENQVNDEINAGTRTRNTSEDQVQNVLVPLIDRVIQHYEHYYATKSRWAKQDVFSMLNPPWRSSFEDAFLWVGGWRPSMAFHLLYSKSGLQFEAKFTEFLRGLVLPEDLGDLSSLQLVQVDELQRKFMKEEREISEKLASTQETVADASMVDLSHVVTELMRASEAEDHDRVESTLEPKEEGLVGILKLADELRMKTLKEVINILIPIQAVHFLIAAAELHLRLHDWGKKKDAEQPRVDTIEN